MHLEASKPEGCGAEAKLIRPRLAIQEIRAASVA